MQILYIASVRIPNEKASGLAIMRQCEAFACLGNTLTLLRPNRKNHLPNDPFLFYGINTKFDVYTFLSIDFVDKIGKLGFYITRFSQMIGSFLYILKNKTKIDLIYARDPWMLFLPVFFLKNKNIIWEAHQKQDGFFVQSVAKKVKRIVCISEGLRGHYNKLGRRDDIVVEPSGVDLDQFHNLPSIETVRKQFNIPLDKKVIGYIGKYTTMGEGKGVDELIKAFGLIYNGNKDTHLLIAGLEADEFKSVSDICEQSNLPESAYTLLHLEQKNFPIYVQIADVLVMNYPNTTHYANYMSPTKLFAYMASNKVVVASDLPSVREIVDDRMVILIKDDNIDSISNALLKSMEHGDNILKMKEHALIHVQKFSWENRTKRILNNL